MRRVVGYCPQHDALEGLLSARETLRMYAAHHKRVPLSPNSNPNPRPSPSPNLRCALRDGRGLRSLRAALPLGALT